MRAIKSIILAAAVLAGAGLQAVSTTPTPTTAQGKVLSFGLNPAFILEVYNAAQQNGGKISSYPADLNPAVVQATVSNASDVDGPLCFQIVLQEQGSKCSGDNLAWSPILTTKMDIKAHETRSLGAADFITSGSYEGAFCSNFQEEFKSDFENIDVNELPKVVDKLLHRRFKVCMVPADCGSNPTQPNSASDSSGSCSNFTLFQPNPGAQASVAVLVYPHNNAVPNCDLNFLWAPALYPGLSSGEIKYTLEIREDMEGEVFARVDVPAGQNYYQWSAKDRALTPGQKYYWRVISRKAKGGAPFGGQDGRGWNVQKWFTCGEAAGKCRVTLQELDQFVQKNAKPEVRDALKGFLVKAIDEGKLDDDSLCRLINGQAKLRSINVIKK